MMHVHHDSPSTWIARFAPLVPTAARVLDFAAGSGRHARLFAARGAQVLAVDRDAGALSALDGASGIATRVVDLEGPTWPLAGERFDAIVVTNYLYRPRLHALRALLAPGGLLLYETFAEGNEAYGRPSNPDFLLRRGELLALAAQAPALTVIAFEQGLVQRASGIAVVQRLAARDGPDWPPPLA